MFPAELDKMPEISLAGPIELTFYLFVMNPENVGRDNLHPARLHFQNFFFPVRLGVAGKVELAHHGQPRLGIFHKVAAVNGERVPRSRNATQMEVSDFRRHNRTSRINRNNRGRGLLEAECQDYHCRKEKHAHGHEYRSLKFFHSPEIELSRGEEICSPTK